MDSVGQPAPEKKRRTSMTTTMLCSEQQPVVTGGQAEQQTEVIYTRLNTDNQSRPACNSDGIQQIPSSVCTPVSIDSNTVTNPSVQKASGTDIARLPSTLTEWESNFLRFCHLVQKVAPQALRSRFDQEFPPDQLNAIIQRNMTLLMELRDKRVLTKAQWKLILPYGAKVTSTNFDVTLMVCFFRHLSSLQFCDYDTLPPPSDESLGADLARIKYYRNYISHCMEKDRKLDNFEYPICWETVSKAISRIGGHRYELECASLLVGTLDQSYMDVYRNFQMEKAELTEKVKIQDKQLKLQKEKLDFLELQMKDPLPLHVRENVESMIDQWKSRDKNFVETEASKYILNVMKTNNFIIVTGSPGSGKSFTVQHVLLLLQNEGYDVIPVTSSSDMVKYFSKSLRRVFYIDNFCGKYNISSNDIEDYQRNKEQMDIMFNCISTKFIFICRLQIYNDPMFKNLHLDNFQVCDFSGNQRISKSEKILIGKQYLQGNIIKTLREDTISKCDCFPLLCSLYKSHAHEGTLFFDHPKTYFEKEMNELKSSPDKIKYTCLALCVMYNDHVPFEIFTSRSDSKAKLIFDAVFEECEVNLSTPKKYCVTQFESMVGSFFSKMETGYKSIHDYMFDIYCQHFCSSMLQCIVEYADSRLLSDRALLQSIGEKDTFGKLLIPVDLEKTFFHRIKQDIINCKIWGVFSAFQLNYKPYRCKLIAVLNSLTHINYEQNGVTPMYVTSLEGYLDILNILVCKGGDVNLCNKNGASPLYAASYNGHKDCVDFLLNKGVDVNKCNNNGASPLYVASQEGHTAILEMLYTKGGDVNLCKKGGFSPLYIASQEGHTDILEMLYNRGGNVNLCNEHGASPLYAASYNGHKDCVDFLLNKGVDVNKCNNNGASPLYVASQEGHTAILEMLFTKGGDVNLCKKGGFSPLYIASQEGHTDILEMLYNRGGNVNLCNEHGASPLFAASYNGHKDCVDFLLNKGVDVNKCNNNGASPLYIASQEGHTDILEMLYNRGGNVNLCNEHGASPLYAASYNGHKDCVDFLLNKGVDVNKCNNNGASPLYVASQEGHTAILEMLYTKGGDVNLCKKGGFSPLYIASQEGHTDILEMLYNRGGNVNLCNEHGASPLFAASYNGHKDCVDFLLNKGVDVNKCNNNGASPLYVASQEGHTAILEMLYTKGCDVNKCKNNGASPLYIASQEGHTDILEMLYNRGGNVNLCNEDGESPLYIASYNGHKDCVDFLLNKGVDVNKNNNDGFSPLYVASQGGHSAIVELLYNRGGNANLCNKDGESPM